MMWEADLIYFYKIKFSSFLIFYSQLEDINLDKFEILINLNLKFGLSAFYKVKNDSDVYFSLHVSYLEQTKKKITIHQPTNHKYLDKPKLAWLFQKRKYPITRIKESSRRLPAFKT